MFCRRAAIWSHSEILASTPRFIQIKWWGGGVRLVFAPAYLYRGALAYLKADLLQQGILNGISWNFPASL